MLVTTTKGDGGFTNSALAEAHTLSVEQTLSALDTNTSGLTQQEVHTRLQRYGPNSLPRAKLVSFFVIFFRQFLSPLIYILFFAAVISVLMQEWTDALFIAAVLVINATIGSIQEYSAQRSANSLQRYMQLKSHVLRNGVQREINSEDLVPGDIVVLQSGSKIPADLRLLSLWGLEVDESLLTGESVPVHKNVQVKLDASTPLAERQNILFAGTIVVHGRASGVVVATGMSSELGHITEAILNQPSAKAPLIIRMESFTTRIAVLIGIAVIIMAIAALFQGTPLEQIFLLAVALAVSAIPEGLPVALTVTLAVGMQRMAKRNVIVRRLVAVEALGSCTTIASDKTGTLTVNELTVKQIALPDQSLDVAGQGMVPEGDISTNNGEVIDYHHQQLAKLCHTGALANEGQLYLRDGQWLHQGDAVDIALLVLAEKAGIDPSLLRLQHRELASIPYEPEHRFAASLNMYNSQTFAHVKGAVETVVPMCSNIESGQGESAIEPTTIIDKATEFGKQGYRVIALARGIIQVDNPNEFEPIHLKNLNLIGLVGLMDPLRPQAKTSIAACQKAGIKVVMITGDHPTTAKSIAKELNLVDEQPIITGQQLLKAANKDEFSELVKHTKVFARTDPQQKLQIVQAMQRNGEFVAVTGDGANDAPALQVAHVGLAMGKSGTDVAREASDLIITDDRFTSIVYGIEEGRIAYANVRKVIFLLISTGAAEIVLFTLALFTGLPLPLVAVQLLWLNLVTNGIQDIALAFEPAEGNEFHKPPRSPSEPIFNKIMVQRVVISALVIGICAYAIFYALLQAGYDTDFARNVTLLLMVLFENVQAFNSRSETLSVFRHSPMRNPILLFGTLFAQLIHIGAMSTPWIQDVLHIQPIGFDMWLTLLPIALLILAVMEIHKWNIMKQAQL